MYRECYRLLGSARACRIWVVVQEFDEAMDMRYELSCFASKAEANAKAKEWLDAKFEHEDPSRSADLVCGRLETQPRVTW